MEDDATVINRFAQEQNELWKVYEYQKTQRQDKITAAEVLHSKCVTFMALKKELATVNRAYKAVVEKVKLAKREAKLTPSLHMQVHEAKADFYAFIESPKNKHREDLIEKQDDILRWLNIPRTRRLRNMVISKIITSHRPNERLFTIASPDIKLLAQSTPKAIKSLRDNETKLFNEYTARNLPGNTQHLTIERYKAQNSTATTTALATHIREITTRECSICMDSMTIEATLGCKHVFHHKCIHNWAGRNPSCPVCRAVIKPRDLVL
jgi:hypothetical protein